MPYLQATAPRGPPRPDDNTPMTEPESTSGPLAAAHRWIAILVLGFASGLPLALTGLAMQAWLTMDGLDFAAIGSSR